MIGIQVTLPTEVLVYDQKAVRRALRSGGIELAAVARALASGGAGGGRVYRGSGGSSKGFRPYKRGRYQASAAGQAPVKVTGTLAKSIKSYLFKRGTGVWIRDAAFYAKMLQAGAKGGTPGGGHHRGRRTRLLGVRSARVLEPRPFLDLAMEARAASVGERVRAAVIEGIAFRKMKP